MAAGASFKDLDWRCNKFHLEKLYNHPFMAILATVVGIHGEVMMSYLTYMRD